MKRIIHLLKQFNLMISAFRPALKVYMFVVLGIAIGMLLVYFIGPVPFNNDAVPAQMDDGFRDQWIKDTANGYQYVVSQAAINTENPQLVADAQNEAQDRLVSVGATTEDIDRLLRANEDVPYLNQSLIAIRAFADDSAANNQLDEFGEAGFFTKYILPIITFLVVSLLGALGIVYVKLFGFPFEKSIRRLLFGEKIDPALEAEKKRRAEARKASEQKTVFDTPPVKQFMSTYLSGDSYYDDSFAIELDDGTFLGECGSGISENIGVGDAKKVTATEVWMFDKNDAKTVTHLFLSEHAYNDQALRTKLAPRGEELILAEEGATTVLETQTLRAQVRVVSLEYGEGGPALNSGYERLTVEIAVWQKEGAGEGTPEVQQVTAPMPPPIQQAPPPQAPPSQPPAYQAPPITATDLPSTTEPATNLSSATCAATTFISNAATTAAIWWRTAVTTTRTATTATERSRVATAPTAAPPSRWTIITAAPATITAALTIWGYE